MGARAPGYSSNITSTLLHGCGVKKHKLVVKDKMAFATALRMKKPTDFSVRNTLLCESAWRPVFP